jgi:hypothetical protein
LLAEVLALGPPHDPEVLEGVEHERDLLPGDAVASAGEAEVGHEEHQASEREAPGQRALELLGSGRDAVEEPGDLDRETSSPKPSQKLRLTSVGSSFTRMRMGRARMRRKLAGGRVALPKARVLAASVLPQQQSLVTNSG